MVSYKPLEITRRYVKFMAKNVFQRVQSKSTAIYFENGRTDIIDEYRIGRSYTSTTTDNIARVNNINQTNRRITTIDEIAETLGTCFGSIHKIITEHLEYRKFCTR